MQGCKIIRHNLQGIQDIIKVLDFGNGSQSAHCHADGLSQDRRFADARICHAHGAVFFLHPLEALVHIAELAHVFTERNETRLTSQCGIERGIDHFKAEHRRRRIRIDRLDLVHFQRGTRIQVRAVSLHVLFVVRLFPLDQNLLGGIRLPA